MLVDGIAEDSGGLEFQCEPHLEWNSVMLAHINVSQKGGDHDESICYSMRAMCSEQVSSRSIKNYQSMLPLQE